MRRALLLLICLPGMVTTAMASRPSLEVSLDPQKLGLEDVARLSVRIVNAGKETPQTSLGQLNNFQILQGPSRESQFSLVNGRASSALKLTWILQPQTTGKAAVGPITVTVGQEKLSAGALLADIVPGSVAPRQARRVSPFGVSDPFENFLGRPRSRQRSLKVALRQLITSSDIVEGEALTVSLVLDTNGGAIDGFEWADPPDYPGFWVQRIEQKNQVRPETVTVDGEPTNRFVISRSVLIPLKAGEISIPAASARIGFRSMSFFSPSSVIQRSTRPLKLMVARRPPAPASFSGAVGKVKYSMTVRPKKLKLGESATIEIKVAGRGNLPLIQAPLKWPECASCKLYPPEEKNSVSVDASGIHGSRSWQATLLPRAPGTVQLKPITISVFDPGTRTYVSQRLGPLSLEVNAPPPTPTPTLPPGVVPSPTATSPDSSKAGSRGLGDIPTWLLLGCALLLGLCGGGGIAWWLTSSSSGKLPPRHRGQSPAERARQLQAALERWWLDLPESARGETAESEMKELRKALEAVRFAPGRADHSETIGELEKRLRRLMR